MKCQCGRAASASASRCSCGARFSVARNGDVGVQREVRRTPRRVGYVVKDGRLKRA